jgi:hypothetical protein
MAHGDRSIHGSHPQDRRRDEGIARAHPLAALMRDLLGLIAFVAGWYPLRQVLLPRLGVPT